MNSGLSLDSARKGNAMVFLMICVLISCCSLVYVITSYQNYTLRKWICYVLNQQGSLGFGGSWSNCVRLDSTCLCPASRSNWMS